MATTRKPASSPGAAADLEVYAAGVAAMQERSRVQPTDPLGWTYQSRMHGRPGARPRQPGEPADWSDCQHGTWFFLPWHRMYLLQFERIIRHVTSTPDWALPYWDYPDAIDVTVPPAFTVAGSALFNGTRAFAPPFVVGPERWRSAGTFEALGGGRAGKQHRGELPGALEQNPHNLIHGRVRGDMADYQSPLDPLFWIHHANIDRLWTVWLGLGARSHPTTRDFLGTSFEFPDPGRSGRKRWTVADVLSTDALGYRYQAPSTIGAGLGTVEPVPEEPRRDDQLTLLAASSSGQGSVRGGSRIPVGAAALRDAVPAAAGAEPIPLYLRLENVGVDSGDASSMWNVFVQTTEGGEPHLVGTIAPFGLAGLSADGGRQTLTFDITDVSRDLIANPERLEVSFESVDPDHVEGEPYYERAALYTIAG